MVLTSTFPRLRDDTDPPFVYELSRRLTKDFTTRAAQATVVSRTIYKALNSDQTCTNLGIIPMGVDGERFSPALRPVEQKQSVAPTLLFVGRFSEKKVDTT